MAQPNLPILPGIPRTGYLALTSVAVADTLSFLDERVELTGGLRQQYVRSRSYSAAIRSTSATSWSQPPSSPWNRSRITGPPAST